MKKEGYLGVDVGGTGAKAAVFDSGGRMLGFGHRGYAPTISAQGHAELAIAQIYEAARAAAREAVQRSQAQILALAVSSQGQTFISLDAEDKPLHPAIMWYDSRALHQARRLRQALLERDDREPPDGIDAIAAGPKIMWLREQHPDLMSRARRFLLLPDYFSYILTGQAVTDPIIAWTTGLYAQPGYLYHPAALQESGIQEEQLARIQPAGAPAGRVLQEIAREWGLSPDTLLATGTNDQLAGALGAGNCRPGIVSETSGSCLALVSLTEKEPQTLPGGLYQGFYPIPPFRYVLAYSKTSGVVLEWFRRELAGATDLAQLDEEARQIPIGSNGLTVIPHFDGMVSPVPNPEVRGVFANLRLQHGRADIYRAILEALSFSLRENLELLVQEGYPVDTVRSIGGGARSDLWLQMKADVTGRVIEKPAITEAAVLGAAMLAAVGCGYFHDLREASASLFKRQRLFSPDEASHRLYSKPYGRYLDLLKRLYSAAKKPEDG